MNSRIDVVVPVYRDVALTRQCLESVLTLSGARLGRLIVVDDAGPEPAMRSMLEGLRDQEPAVRLLVNSRNEGFVRSCNRGLAVAAGDVVILNSDTRVTAGWLDELAAALEDPLVAAACPLSNNGTLCSIPHWGRSTPVEAVDARTLGTEAIDRFTDLPTGVGFCMLMRGTVLAAVGPFDELYGRGYNEENDWCQRVRAAGYRVVRANRAFVFHHGEVSFAGAKAELDRHNARRLVARYTNYLQDNRCFEEGLDAHLAAIAYRALVTPRVSVIEADGGSWVELSAFALRANLAAAGVALDDDAPEVVVLVGTPRLEDLAPFIARPAHLAWLPGELARFDGRPLGPPFEEARSRRAAAALLSGAATTWVGAEREAHRVELLVGRLARKVVAPFGFYPDSPPEARPAWVMPRASCSPAELGLLLERWAHAAPSDTLELWCDAGRVPAGWRGRLEALRVKTLEIACAERVRLIQAAQGVVLPVEGALESPEARAALAAGVPVEALGPTTRFDARRGAAVPQERFDWAGEVRALCAGSHPPTVARRRAADLLGALTRSPSSSG